MYGPEYDQMKLHCTPVSMAFVIEKRRKTDTPEPFSLTIYTKAPEQLTVFDIKHLAAAHCSLSSQKLIRFYTVMQDSMVYTANFGERIFQSRNQWVARN